jgi:predicted nucleotidyltransferase
VKSVDKTPSLVSASRAWLRARDARRAELRRKLWGQAKQDADRIIAMIVREFRPARIYQWGSIVHPEHFAEYSDVDIAVEGLPGGASEYFRLLAEAERLTSFPLDIVELEHIEPEFAELIRTYGVMRYER